MVEYETLTESEWARVQEVWDLLDDDRLDDAREALDRLLATRRGHPDLRIVDAALLLEESEPRRALAALNGAERSADPAVYFHLRGLARHDLLEFDEALADGERALAIRPDMPEAHDLVSRVLEHLGKWDEAAEHAEQANALDPERYPLPLEVADDEFDAIVKKAISELPAPVRKELDHLPVIVEPLPEPAILLEDDPPLAPDLLGLFVGRHLMERTHGDLPGAPGLIHLFRRNLLRMCGSHEELEREIRITVQHEVGHLLGLDEDDLDRWGLA